MAAAAGAPSRHLAGEGGRGLGEDPGRSEECSSVSLWFAMLALSSISSELVVYTRSGVWGVFPTWQPAINTARRETSTQQGEGEEGAPSRLGWRGGQGYTAELAWAGPRSRPAGVVGALSVAKAFD